MGPVSRCAAAATAALALAASSAVFADSAFTRHTGAAPSIAQFAAETDFSTPTLSPDGHKLAFVTRVNGEPIVVVQDLEKRELRQIMKATAESFQVTWCTFKADDRLVCGFSGTRFERSGPYAVSRLVSIGVSGMDMPKLLVQNGPQGGSQFQDRVFDWQIDDPRRVLIQLGGDGSPYPAVWSLDVYTGRMKLVQRKRYPIMYWSTDRHGVVRFGSGYDDRRSQYITRDSARSPWRTVAKWRLGRDDFDVIGFGPTPGTLLVEADHNGRAAIFEMDLDEKSDRQLLFSHNEVDVGGPIYWPADGRIVGFTYETERVHRMLFDDEAAAIYGGIDELLPDAENYVIDASRDGRRLLVESYRDVRPTEYHLVDLAANKMWAVGSASPALAGGAFAPMKPVKIRGPDGQTLPGYLTVPLESGGRNLPMVVYPHGGPYYRDSWGFDSMVQFMASRGYAVLQVNFRGSTGYGREWYDAGLRNWGTVMVDDITASTKWAIEEGIADPARICIAGWSYGGYAALMSAVREPDLYRCVVSIAGVSDLRALASETRRFHGGRYRADHSIGSDSDELKAGSPLLGAERIKAPVLLVHGDNDIQVLVDHSRRMARALESKDKEYELAVIRDGNHSLSRYEWREQLLRKLEGFLGREMSGDFRANFQANFQAQAPQRRTPP
jgi:dipeptidyl aminopeptidase/acylaminoacyl peptidase